MVSRFNNTFSGSFHDTAVGETQGTSMGVFTNSPTGNCMENAVHQQRWYSSLRDSRPTYKPVVGSANQRIASPAI